MEQVDPSEVGFDAGRLAAITYFDVRRWARQAGETAVAEHAATMITEVPHASRDAFLAQVDHLMAELEQVQSRLAEPAAITPQHLVPVTHTWHIKHA